MNHKLKVLVVGDDIEALVAGYLLSKKFNVTVAGNIYKGLERYYNPNEQEYWNSIVSNYINKTPFISWRNRNIRRTFKIDDMLEFFNMQKGYDFEDLETEFNENSSYKYLEDSKLGDIDPDISYKSIFSIYDGKEYQTISKYLLNKKDRLKKYKDKLWPKGTNGRCILQDPENLASQNLCRIYFYDLIKKLIEYCRPIYHNLENDAECEDIIHDYDYVFYTDKLFNKQCSLAYHLTFECFMMKAFEIFQYDNIYFNDDSNLLRIYSNGDCYHALLKYEKNKDQLEYQKEVSDYAGDCIFIGAGNIVRNHVLVSKQNYSVLPNTKTNKLKKEYLFQGNKIYSRTTLGYVESLDMFVESVGSLEKELINKIR